MAEQITQPDREELFSHPDLPFDLPPGEANNYFFEDGDGNPQGRSWNGEVEGLKATVGQIKAGTSYRYTIDEPEVICVHSGEVSYLTKQDMDSGYSRSHMFPTFGPNMAFDLPVGEEIELRVPLKEDQRPSGRPDDKPSDLVYTCFYPKTSEEFRQIIGLISRVGVLTPGKKHFYLGSDPASGIDKQPDLI